MSDENPQPGQPDGVLAYILRELVEVQTVLRCWRHGRWRRVMR